MLCLMGCEFSSDQGVGGSGVGSADGTSTGESSGSTEGLASTSGPTTTQTPTDASTTASGPTTGETQTTQDSTTGADESSTSMSSSTSSGDPTTLEIAEELLVSLDAVGGDASPSGWVNAGTMDDFESVGAPALEMVDDVAAVTLSRDNVYRSSQNPPTTLVEPDATRSIEVWVFNPEAADYEPVVSWGRRNQGAGTLMAFGYGTQPDAGAVDHWGTAQGTCLGWDGVPQQGVWHHLAYTFDGVNIRVYEDGQRLATKKLGPGALDTVDDGRIVLGAQTRDDGNLGVWASVSVARVRVHAGVLSDAQVLNNYALESAELGL